LPRSEGIEEASGLCRGRRTGGKGRNFLLSAERGMTELLVRGQRGRANESVATVAMQAGVRRAFGEMAIGPAEG